MCHAIVRMCRIIIGNALIPAPSAIYYNHCYDYDYYYYYVCHYYD